MYYGLPFEEEGAIGVAWLSRDGGRIEREMASGGHVDWFVGARDRRNHEAARGANHLWVAEVAGVGTRSAQGPGMTAGGSQGCLMGAQVREIEEAETTAPHLTAVVFALGGSWIGHEWRSVSMNCLTPWFGAQDVEEKLRRFLFG